MYILRTYHVLKHKFHFLPYSNMAVLWFFIRPSLDGTYYGMALSVRPSVRLFVRPSLKKKIKCRPMKKVLKNPDCLKELKRLKEQFVLVPIDKAANNIGFKCKKYFLEVLLQETKSNTYVPYQDSAESIINAVAKKCLEIGIPVKGDNKTLPQIHATIKMHKNPVKFRFIIGARNCVTKQIAKKLVKIFQLIMKIHRRYCNKIKFYTGIERFWIIENNAQVLEDIKLINSKWNVRNIKTFDFSTLYTKIL